MGQPRSVPYGEKNKVLKVVDNILSKKKSGYKKYSTLTDPHEWEEY